MSLFKSIATFGGFTLLSRITGFGRDMVLANFLGAGAISDAFFVAFKLPNCFRSLFAEGAFTTAFVPMLSQKLVGEGKAKSMEFAAQAISVLTFFLAIFVLLMEIFMPAVVEVLAPGFAESGGKVELATTLSRITFPFLLFISIVSFQSGILNSLGKFAAPAAAPIILNLMMILSVFLFVPFSVTPAHGIAIGVTCAGFLEILWLSWFLHRENVRLRPYFNIFEITRNPEIKTLFKRIAPGILGAGVYQLNMFVDTVLVSLVGTGAISWLYYANRLQQLPLGVVGAAIGVALLPILSQHLKGENVDEAKKTQDKAVEYGALLSLPATVGLIILAKPMIDILFQHGRFNATDTEMTAQALIAYAIGLPLYVLVKALAPNFFARGDTRTPVKYSIIVLITNLVFCLLLMKPFGHVGIASATTIAAFVSLYQYVRGLKKRGYWQFSRPLFIKLLNIIFCSVIMGIVMEGTQLLLNLRFGNWLECPFAAKLTIFIFLGILGVASFLVMAKLTGVLHISEIIKSLSRGRGKKNVKQQA